MRFKVFLRKIPFTQDLWKIDRSFGGSVQLLDFLGEEEGSKNQ